MSETPSSIAQVLIAWIEAKGGSIYPRAVELGISSHTLKGWSEGKTLPKRRDLLTLAAATGYDLEGLQALHASDHAAKLAGIPTRIDTPEQAAAWAASRAPVAQGEDGAAAESHALEDAATVAGGVQ